MRLYITTTSYIGNVMRFFQISDAAVSENQDPGQLNKDDDAKVIVFYGDDDTAKMSDVADLYAKVQSVELMPVADRDDMLILLGTLINTYADGQDASIMVLDPSLKVPRRYETKVTVVDVPATKTKSTRGGSRGRRKKAEKTEEKPEDLTPSNPMGLEGAVNPPEDVLADTDNTEQVVDTDQSDQDEDDPTVFDFKVDPEEIKKNS